MTTVNAIDVAQAIHACEDAYGMGASLASIARALNVTYHLVVDPVQWLLDNGYVTKATDGLRVVRISNVELPKGTAWFLDHEGKIARYTDLLDSDITFLIRTGWERIA